jgi:hypothetical protein
MEKAKKVWKKPVLIVIGRASAQENSLQTACKTSCVPAKDDKCVGNGSCKTN